MSSKCVTSHGVGRYFNEMSQTLPESNGAFGHGDDTKADRGYLQQSALRAAETAVSTRRFHTTTSPSTTLHGIDDPPVTTPDTTTDPAPAMDTATPSLSQSTLPSEPKAPQLTPFVVGAAASGVFGSVPYSAIKAAVRPSLPNRLFRRRSNRRHLEAIAREAIQQRYSRIGLVAHDFDGVQFEHRRDTRYCYVEVRSVSGRGNADVRIPVELADHHDDSRRIKVTLYAKTMSVQSLCTATTPAIDPATTNASYR